MNALVPPWLWSRRLVVCLAPDRLVSTSLGVRRGTDLCLVMRFYLVLNACIQVSHQIIMGVTVI